MPLTIKCTWSIPVLLQDDNATGFYSCQDIKDLPWKPGCYVFGRIVSGSLVPFYVGKGVAVQGRVAKHFYDLGFCKRLREIAEGDRVVVACVVEHRHPKKAITLLEKLLIRNFLARGYQILNVQGTKRPQHSFQFSMNDHVKGLLDEVMYLEAAT